MERYSTLRTQGAGLTDLMVGLAIGLIATLVVLNVAMQFDARRRATASGAEAQLNAVQSLALLSRELRNAGNGLGPPDALGCVVHRASAGSPNASFLLAPAVIIDGDDGAPDTLLLLSAGEQALPPARLVTPYTMGGDTLTLDSTLGLANDVHLLLQSTGQPDCALLQLTSVAIGAYTAKSVATSNLLAGQVFGIGSAAINLGSLRYRRYSIDANQRLRMEVFDPTLGSWVASAVADGIASLQWQYGFDDRAGTQSAPQVTRWADNMIDADGNGTEGNSGDWQRVLALRFALVTRSAQRKDEGCNSAAPKWTAGQPAAPEETEIRVDHLTDWKCWRYRVLQGEVPLRNQLWGGG